MKISKSLFFFTLLCAYTNIYAQLSTHEQPVSFDPKLKLTVISKSSNPQVIMPSLDMAKIEAEDKAEEGTDIPPRFGYPHNVNYNLNNSGTWYHLPNGGKLWQLNVVCPKALSVSFLYDKFWIPEGGKFFIYTKDQKQAIGAFTSRNNKGDKDHVRGFATELLFSSDVVLEYYQPEEVTEDAVISINRIVHGYRSFRNGDGGYEQSDWCQVDINCSDGQNWQNEKKAVALIVYGNRIGSGALVNTTDMGQQPYFLTAKHNLVEDTITHITPYAEGDSVLAGYVFYWNYEKTKCNDTCPEPTPFTTNGAIVVADYSWPDFALFRLMEDPKNISGYTPYYLGWDHSGSPGAPGVCIHHPRGDVKKISTVNTITAIFDSINGCPYYWRVIWGAGITDNGSSGSPLLNNEHRVIGLLKSGNSNCDNLYAADYFSMFYIAWSPPDTGISIHQRLDHWLDPLSVNLETIEGLLIIPSDSIMNTNQIIYSNIRIKSTAHLTIQNNVELMGNCRVIVESGGQLIIDGGKLSNVDIELKTGATLRVINDGTIECHNKIIAPVGALIDIVNGKII